MPIHEHYWIFKGQQHWKGSESLGGRRQAATGQSLTLRAENLTNSIHSLIRPRLFDFNNVHNYCREGFYSSFSTDSLRFRSLSSLPLSLFFNVNQCTFLGDCCRAYRSLPCCMRYIIAQQYVHTHSLCVGGLLSPWPNAVRAVVVDPELRPGAVHLLNGLVSGRERHGSSNRRGGRSQQQRFARSSSRETGSRSSTRQSWYGGEPSHSG